MVTETQPSTNVITEKKAEMNLTYLHLFRSSSDIGPIICIDFEYEYITKIKQKIPVDTILRQLTYFCATHKAKAGFHREKAGLNK